MPASFLPEKQPNDLERPAIGIYLPVTSYGGISRKRHASKIPTFATAVHCNHLSTGTL